MKSIKTRDEMVVKHITGSDRPYFSAIEDGEEIGQVNYSMNGNRMSITFVGINQSHRGGGRARELMMSVIDYARNNDIKIIPICTYAAAIFERYPNTNDVLHKNN